MHLFELGLEDINEIVNWMHFFLLAQSSKVDVRHESELTHTMEEFILVINLILVLERTHLRNLKSLIRDDLKVSQCL